MSLTRRNLLKCLGLGALAAPFVPVKELVPQEVKTDELISEAIEYELVSNEADAVRAREANLARIASIQEAQAALSVPVGELLSVHHFKEPITFCDGESLNVTYTISDSESLQIVDGNHRLKTMGESALLPEIWAMQGLAKLSSNMAVSSTVMRDFGEAIVSLEDSVNTNSGPKSKAIAP